MTTYRGRNYCIEAMGDGNYRVSPDSSATEEFGGWQELVEAHPVCAAARDFFFGDTLIESAYGLVEGVE